MIASETDPLATSLDVDYVDPWGNPLQLRRDGQHAYVVSYGPDGEAQTEDDLAVVITPLPKLSVPDSSASIVVCDPGDNSPK